MTLSFAGLRALVCGASRGIGRACAEALAENGASVVLVARDESRLAEVQKSLTVADGAVHHAIAADLSRPELAVETLKRALQDVGSVQILINNTGGPPGGPLLNARIEELLGAFTGHVLAAHLLAQLIVPQMRESGYGRIVNIISTSVKQPIKDLGVSNTVRGAMASWAKTLAEELGPAGITVNNVLPGSTQTDRITEIIEGKSRTTGRAQEEIRHEMERQVPLGRFALPQEIAAVVAFLCSPAASYVNGVSIPVDGGRTRSF